MRERSDVAWDFRYSVCCQRALHHGHANGEAVGDLLKDRRLRAIGYAGRNLHAADDWPRMEHDRLWRERCQPLAGELIAGLVVLEIELHPREPLRLNAQHHDGLRLLERGLEVALDLDAGAGARGLFG